jgi:trimethylamine--corrinoid protein Co-methyltransferase
MIRSLYAGMLKHGGLGLQILTDDDLDQIHSATLEVLQRTGVFVEDETAREVFHGAGAAVDAKTSIVRIPPHLVEEAVRSAPSKFIACGRTPEKDVVLESSRVTFTNFGEGIVLRDMQTGELRETTKDDARDAARLIDALEHIDTYERAVLSHDVPQEVCALHNAEASLTNTVKHHWIGPVDGYCLSKIVDMCAAIVGGHDRLRARPLVTFNTCPVSPLKLVQDTCEIIMGSAEHGMAVNVLSMGMAGGSTPVHLAGTLVVHNAEVLSGLVLNQLTRRGAPVVYGSSTTAMDLRLASASVGTPECAVINAAVARLARYYALPSFVAGG